MEWVGEPWSKYTIRNRFSELKIGLGFPPTKVFHSLRHTLASRLHECEVQEATAAKIIGHKHGSLTFGWYGDKVRVETLRKPINLARYSALLLAFGSASPGRTSSAVCSGLLKRTILTELKAYPTLCLSACTASLSCRRCRSRLLGGCRSGTTNPPTTAARPTAFAAIIVALITASVWAKRGRGPAGSADGLRAVAGALRNRLSATLAVALIWPASSSSL